MRMDEPLDAETLAAFHALADRLDALDECMERYIAENRAFFAEIEQEIAAARSGRRA